MSVMQKGAIKYYPCFRDLLHFEEKFLKAEWFSYAERYLRRNLGVHSGWIADQKYKERLAEIRKKAKENQIDLEFPESSGDFVGFEVEYFLETCSLAETIIQELSEHCIKQFSLPRHEETDAASEQATE
jgi:hypothetical protein